MKKFTKTFGPRPVLETATQSDIVTMTHDEFYDHMKHSWRAAYKSIRNEINSEDAPSISELLMFIDEELNE